MKTNTLSVNAINHLKGIGYQLQDTVDNLRDAPYLFIIDNKVSAVSSANMFRFSLEELVEEEFILKLRPAGEKDKVSKLSMVGHIAYQLLGILNNSENSKITGYDVSWDIKGEDMFSHWMEIFPISPHACGSISLEHLRIILKFAEGYPSYMFRFGYTNVNNEKEIYGTFTPCIIIC